MARQGFVIYHKDYDNLAALTDAEFRVLMDALRAYSETGEIVNLTGAPGMAYGFMARSIDGDEERYQARCQRSQRANSARWGGADKHPNASSSILTHPSDPNTNTKPNTNTNTNTNTNNEDIGVVATPPPTQKKPAARFVPPTVEEVAAYCKERGNSVDPEYFIAYYEANGWTQGKGKRITSWRAAVITWEKRDKERGAYNGRQNATNRGAAGGGNDKPDILGSWNINGRTIV